MFKNCIVKFTKEGREEASKELESIDELEIDKMYSWELYELICADKQLKVKEMDEDCLLFEGCEYSYPAEWFQIVNKMDSPKIII